MTTKDSTTEPDKNTRTDPPIDPVVSPADPILRFVDGILDLSAQVWLGQRNELRTFIKGATGGQYQKFGDWSRELTKLWSTSLSGAWALTTFPFNYARGDGETVPTLVLFAGGDTAGPRSIPVPAGPIPVVAFTPPMGVSDGAQKASGEAIRNRISCVRDGSQLLFSLTGGTDKPANDAQIKGHFLLLAYNKASGSRHPLAFIHVIGEDVP